MIFSSLSIIVFLLCLGVLSSSHLRTMSEVTSSFISPYFLFVQETALSYSLWRYLLVVPSKYNIVSNLVCKYNESLLTFKLRGCHQIFPPDVLAVLQVIVHHVLDQNSRVVNLQTLPGQERLDHPQPMAEHRSRLPRNSGLHSHWSRNVEAWLSMVESFSVLLRQQSYAIKHQLGHPKRIAGSL